MIEKLKGIPVRVAVLTGFLGACVAPLDTEQLPEAGADTGTATAAVGETIVIDETFTSSAANFTVVSGGTWAVSNGQYVLTNPSSTIVNGNISVHNTAVTGDFILSADGKTTPTSTSNWNDFSIIFNYQDASNYYYVSLNESNDGGTNGVFKVVSGTKTELADITSVITAGTMYTVKVEKTGSGIKAYLNGVLVASVSDATFTGGKVGLGTMNDGATFDNVKVLKPAAALLSWRPPALTSPITVNVSNTNRSLTLDPAKDYIIKFAEVISSGNLSITGGRNVVLIGGHITVPWRGAWPVDGNLRRGLYLKHWTGTMHVEGLLIDGEDLAEAIDVDTRTLGATLQIQNVRVGYVHGRPEESACYTCSGVHHPDIIQNWGGPTYYRIDRLTGSTNYQGLMMQPTQYGYPTVLADFRNMNLVGDGGYLIFRTSSGTDDYVFRNAWFHKTTGSKYAYPESDPEWSGFSKGVPPGGDFVPAGVAGMNYVSPGYAN
jgi:hypothetical protein